MADINELINTLDDLGYNMEQSYLGHFAKACRAAISIIKTMGKQWTPIDKKKPPYDKDVLFYMENGKQIVGRRENHFEQDEYTTGNLGGAFVYCPTHWMKLPKPPTEKKG